MICAVRLKRRILIIEHSVFLFFQFEPPPYEAKSKSMPKSLVRMCDPDDNEHLIIDSETAPIIRRIFDLVIDGMGNIRICIFLMEEQIPKNAL